MPVVGDRAQRREEKEAGREREEGKGRKGEEDREII